MSRIGKKPIPVPSHITVSLTDKNLKAKSDQAELQQPIPNGIKVDIKDKQILVSVTKHNNKTKALHGLTRSLIANMITGLSQGYEKVLEIQGTGYRAHQKDKAIELSLGYSHPIIYQPPPHINLSVEENKLIRIKGFDKQLVGQVAAEIRQFRRPDAYKGKGIRYQGEKLKLKPGKSAKAEEAAT